MACKHQVFITVGTVMHKTRTPLVAWFWAIYLIAHDNRGSSALFLKKALEVSYKTAWTMAHKIRKAMADRDGQYKLASLVKIDNAYIGCPSDGGDKTGRGTEKTPVIIAISSEENDQPSFVEDGSGRKRGPGNGQQVCFEARYPCFENRIQRS